MHGPQWLSARGKAEASQWPTSAPRGSVHQSPASPASSPTSLPAVHLLQPRGLAVWDSLNACHSLVWGSHRTNPSLPSVPDAGVAISVRSFLVTLPEVGSPVCPTAISDFLFLPGVYHGLTQFRLRFLFSIYVPSPGCKLKEGRVFCLFGPLLYPQSLEQYLL